MKAIKYPILLALSANCLCSCTTSPPNKDLGESISGKYASSDENEYDYFKDTVEIRLLDDGKFDVATIANWSSAKKSDPQRPANKIAGVWNNYFDNKVSVAELQTSDTTLRITEPLTGEVRILSFDIDKKTMKWPQKNSGVKTYSKVQD